MNNLQNNNADLRHRNEQLEQLIEMVAEGMMVIDKVGKIVLVNSAMEKILCYKKAEIIGSYHCDARWRLKCQDSPDMEWIDIFNLILARGQSFDGKECVMEEGVNKDKIYNYILSTSELGLSNFYLHFPHFLYLQISLFCQFYIFECC